MERTWLKIARQKKNLTKRELGKKLHVSESYYSRIEAGERQQILDLVIAVNISKALDISIEEIAAYEYATGQKAGA